MESAGAPKVSLMAAYRLILLGMAQDASIMGTTATGQALFSKPQIIQLPFQQLVNTVAKLYLLVLAPGNLGGAVAENM